MTPIKLPHPWPFPVVIKNGRTYRVVNKRQPKPTPKFEPAPF